MKLNVSLYGVILLALFTGTSHADVSLPNIFSDNMVIQRDKPIRVWGWATPDEQVKVKFKWKSARTRADASGRWIVELPAMQASAKPRTLVVKGPNKIAIRNILVGEVWLCSGQSNMEWPMHGTQHWREETNAFPEIRLCKVPKLQIATPTNNATVKWTLCAGNDKAGFSGVGFHFGKTIHEAIDVPVGLIQAAVGGTSIEPWTTLSGYDTIPSLKHRADQIRNQPADFVANFWTPASLYNGMVYPVIPMSMRGIIWYQGESNVYEKDTDIYSDKMHALVNGWRKNFHQQDLAFYFVQLAPYTYHGERDALPFDSLPLFWDAQLHAMRTITNSGMVVVSDVTGNTRDIHPRHKRKVGQRLARWALARNYGKTNMVTSGPIFRKMIVKGTKAILDFDFYAEGLKSRDGHSLTAFSMAGPDEIFKPAAALIENNTLVVTSPYVETPTAVRYAWHESAVGNLCNSEDLPALPFRTDNYETKTLPLVVHQTVLPNAKTEAGIWRYVLDQPPDEWMSPDFDDSAWQEGEGGFGTSHTPNTKIGTMWNTGGIWLRRSFEIRDKPSGVYHVQVHHDEDAVVFINGIRAADAPWFNGDYELLPINAYAAATLKQGRNTIAVYCNQLSGGQYIDVGLVTTK
jgi:sialate O-acetylesterase